jgi:hypothetical protein
VVKVPVAGRYTVVMGAHERTIKFEQMKAGHYIISYLMGPDNTQDFIKCGVLETDGSLRLWHRWYRKGTKVNPKDADRNYVRQAIEYLCGLSKDEQLAAGEMYALKSGSCFICGRDLTVASSISAGIGPVCAKRWGVDAS